MSNPADTLDFAMHSPIRTSAKQLRTPAKKRAIARKAIDRDAKASYEAELADLKRQKEDWEQLQRDSDDGYVRLVSRQIHKLIALEETATGDRLLSIKAEIEERTNAITSMGLEVLPPF